MCKDCYKLITSQEGPQGPQGEPGIDGILDWTNYDLECLIDNEIINEGDTPEQITQKLINFWCIAQSALLSPPIAYNNIYTTPYETVTTFNPTLNDDYTTSVNVTITTNPVNGTAVVSNIDNKTITYTPNNSFSGNDTLIYTITDQLGQTSTATVTITVNPPIGTECQTLEASHIADLSTYTGKLKIKLVNTTDYLSNIPGSNEYLIEVKDIDNNVLYSYIVVGNTNTTPQSFLTPQEIEPNWFKIIITQTVESSNNLGEECSTVTDIIDYMLTDFQVSIYDGVDISCLELGENPTDTEITQEIVDKVCSIEPVTQSLFQREITIFNTSAPAELFTSHLQNDYLNTYGALGDYYLATGSVDSADSFSVNGTYATYNFDQSFLPFIELSYTTPTLAYDTVETFPLFFTNGSDFIILNFTIYNTYQPVWNHLESTDGFFLQADLEPYGIKQLTSGYIYDRINVSYQISNSNLYLNYFIIANVNISLGTDPIVIRPDYLLTGTGYEYDDNNTFPVIGTGNATNYAGPVPINDWIGYQLSAADDGSKNLIFVSTPVSAAGGGPIIFSLTPDNLIKLQIHYSAVIPLRKV